MSDTLYIVPIEELRSTLMADIKNCIGRNLAAYISTLEDKPGVGVKVISAYATAVAALTNVTIHMVGAHPGSLSREQAEGIVRATLQAALHDLGLKDDEMGTHRNIIKPDGKIERGDH